MALKIKTDQLKVSFPVISKKRLFSKPGRKNSASTNEFRALDGISVEIRDGERVGLLGINGAGKSTFLKVLAGVYAPTSGKLEINGCITSLFDVKVGLDKEASGYENIPLLMAARGIPRSQSKHLLDDIVEFTELGDALDRPIRTYSSGMQLRIAFAVATAQSADILLMDEIIGVGDKNFRVKSMMRTQRLLSGSGTLLLASHSAAYLTEYCSRGLIFESGKIIADGPIDEMIEQHEKSK
ncbi:ATP-binding cassette domain-containing protein [Pacificibacter sp.]|uniref:ABC transporter ATP-binding protein n=1 Tax=Pacificibacter sp. TaxID=1917866 RepID=UPI0032195F76